MAAADAATLFEARYVNLSLASTSETGEATVRVSNFGLQVPPQTAFGARAADPWLLLATVASVVWFLLFLVRQMLTRLRQDGRPVSKIWERYLKRFTLGKLAVVAVGVLALAAIYGSLAPFDAHPYDRLAQESYAYVIDQYGIGALYERTEYLPDTTVRSCHDPWSTTPIAYP